MKRKLYVIAIFMLFITANLPFISSAIEFKAKDFNTYPLIIENFEIDAFCGGFAPWTPLYRVQINQSGNGIYSIMPAEDRGIGGFTVISEFNISANEMNQLISLVLDNNFFSLDNKYSTIAGDGTFANISITIGDLTHSVETRNIAVLGFDNISKMINSFTPDDYDLIYNAIVNVPPNQPSSPRGIKNGSTRKEYSYTTSTSDDNLDDIYYWFEWGDGTNSGWIGPYKSGETASASHKWSEEGNFSIEVQAKDDPDRDGDLSDGFESIWSDPLPISMPKIRVSNGLLTKIIERFYQKYVFLGYFFDFISNQPKISLSNNNEPSGTRVTINECKIKVDIYIQIYGPGATVALTQTIETDIEDMWNTDKDGNKWMIPCKVDCDRHEPGCSVEFDAHVVRMDEMHRLPGFHTWHVGKDASGTNHGAQVNMWDTDQDGIGDSPHGNDDTVPTTTGRVDDNEPDNTYAHEAGHLMGLRDQYNEVGTDTNGNNQIDPDERRTEPKPNHTEDIMGTLNGKPLQEAIERIVELAGVECPCECCPEEEDEVEPDVNIDNPQSGSSTTSPVNVTGSASDINGSGVAELDYKLDWATGSYEGDSIFIDPSAEFIDFELGPINLEYYIAMGEWITITIYAIDVAGNIGSDSVSVIWEEGPDDTTPPVTEKTIGDPNEDGGYIIWPITPITLHAIDDLSGVNYIHFEILWDSDGDQEVDTVMADENIPNDTVIFWVEQYGILSGLIHIKYFAVDNSGNAEYPHNQVHLVQSI